MQPVLVEEQPTYIVQQVALSAPTRDIQNLHSIASLVLALH